MLSCVVMVSACCLLGVEGQVEVWQYGQRRSSVDRSAALLVCGIQHE